MSGDINFYFSVVFDVFMVFSPNIGFVAQILKFRSVKSSEGFSKFLSFILLIANILRIFFWVGKRFALPLLFQSILMVVMQLILLRECLIFSNFRTTNKQTPNPYIDQPINIFDLKFFWNWPYLIDYIYFLVLFIVLIGFVSHFVGYDNYYYVELLGAASASVEAVIGLPQIYQNFKTKNTASLSLFMIYTWVIGDSIKTFYFVKTQSPFQLICCGIFQLTMDMVILLQIFLYSKGKTSVETEQTKNTKKKIIEKKNDDDLYLDDNSDDSNVINEIHDLNEKIGFI